MGVLSIGRKCFVQRQGYVRINRGVLCINMGVLRIGRKCFEQRQGYVRIDRGVF